jgi:Secretion system C-terminal sorting domain
VQQTSDGGYIVSGGTRGWGPSGCPLAYLIKFDVSGSIQWTKVFGNTCAEARDLTQTTDGGYIITGYVSNPTYADIYLIKTNASGDTLWAKTYGAPLSSSEEGRSVQQTSDGGYIISGVSSGNMCLIKTDGNGDTLWTRGYASNFTDVAYSVNQTLDGGYILAGSSYSGNTFIACMIRTDANGDTLWSKTYDGNLFYSCQQTTDSGFIVYGQRNGKVYLVKTDINGNSGCTQGNFAITLYHPAPVVSNYSFVVQSPISNLYNNPLIESSHGGDTTLCLTVGIMHNEIEEPFFISPNPSTGKIIISFNDKIHQGVITISDLTGSIAHREKIFAENNKEMMLENVRPGIYFVRMQYDEKDFCRKLVVVRN